MILFRLIPNFNKDLTQYDISYTFVKQIKNKGTMKTTANLTYDVVFDSESRSNSKGFEESQEYCMNYINSHNGTDESYFKDYKGGIVSVICHQTGETVFQTEVK